MTDDTEFIRTPMFLLPAELRQLTEFSRRREQRRRLQEMGIPFKVGRNGRPLVLREIVQREFGTQRPNTLPSGGPDIGALRELQHG